MKSMLLKVNIAIISIGSTRNHLHFVLKFFFFCIVTWISKDLIQAELYEKNCDLGVRNPGFCLSSI